LLLVKPQLHGLAGLTAVDNLKAAHCGTPQFALLSRVNFIKSDPRHDSLYRDDTGGAAGHGV
jgi:hypothetical protein